MGLAGYLEAGWGEQCVAAQLLPSFPPRPCAHALLQPLFCGQVRTGQFSGSCSGSWLCRMWMWPSPYASWVSRIAPQLRRQSGKTRGRNRRLWGATQPQRQSTPSTAVPKGVTRTKAALVVILGGAMRISHILYPWASTYSVFFGPGCLTQGPGSSARSSMSLPLLLPELLHLLREDPHPAILKVGHSDTFERVAMTQDIINTGREKSKN